MMEGTIMKYALLLCFWMLTPFFSSLPSSSSSSFTFYLLRSSCFICFFFFRDFKSFKIWDLRKFEKESPVAHFQFHRAPITSIEWSGTEDSVVATSSADHTCIVWDMSLEVRRLFLCSLSLFLFLCVFVCFVCLPSSVFSHFFFFLYFFLLLFSITQEDKEEMESGKMIEVRNF